MQAARRSFQCCCGLSKQASVVSVSRRTVSTSSSPLSQPEDVEKNEPERDATGRLISRAKRAKASAYQDMLEKVRERRARRYTADQFTLLGSTQNKSNTWRSSDSLKSPPTSPAVTQSHLLAAGAHLGHTPQFTHRAYRPLIYGVRSGISHIDIRQTLPALRRAAQIVRGVVERNGVVLFLGCLEGTEQAVWQNAKRLEENGFGTTRWIPGTISNANTVFSSIEWDKTDPNAPKFHGFKKEMAKSKNLSSAQLKPSLLICLSPALNKWAIHEATMYHIPTIGIVDTELDPRIVTYSIPANDDSPRTVELIAGVLGMAGRDGLMRRRKQESLAQELVEQQEAQQRLLRFTSLSNE